MSESDGDYHASSDDELPRKTASSSNAKPSVGVGTRRTTRSTRTLDKPRARWEESLQDRTAAALAAAGGIGLHQSAEDVQRAIEARKRARIRQDLQPVQRGIIRHVALVMDLSEPMLERDMRPNRFAVQLRAVQTFVGDYFEQNPISQLCLLGMYDGRCVALSEGMSGNPTDHLLALSRLQRGVASQAGGDKSAAVFDGAEDDDSPLSRLEPKGDPSLQNALEMCRAMLYHTPKHGTREVVIILGALFTNDPGDIRTTIANVAKDKIRVNIIGLIARMKICQDIVAKTNHTNDNSGYEIAIDQYHITDLLRAITAPPAIRESESDAHMANLLVMGFPSRVDKVGRKTDGDNEPEEAGLGENVDGDDEPSFCACHTHKLTRGGYICPQCQAKVCSLPQSCPVCGLTLILSTHLARSYHHLFPLRNFGEVSWGRARQAGSLQCTGCMRPFPPCPPQSTDAENGDANDGKVLKQIRLHEKPNTDGASESARYECQNCRNHFCVDCDVFCHQTLFNCPGCQG